MASFKDSTGAVVLPTVDADGNVPVSVDGLTVEQRVDLMILRELRHIRALLAFGQGIPASTFEPLSEIDGLQRLKGNDMLSPGSLLKGLVRRFLPSPVQEGPESEGYARLLRYQELAIGSMVRKSHLLADEGSYFVVNNAQTGISEGLNVGWVVTTPTMYMANVADPSDPTAKSIYLDYVDLSVQTAGVTATAVQQQQLAVYLDKGNNYSSAGTDLSSKIVNVNPRVQGASVAKCYFGALVTTTPSVAKGTTRPIVGARTYRMAVTASTAPNAVGDRLRLEFGGVEAESTGPLGTTGALMANVFQAVQKTPPVVVPPGWSVALYTWTLCAGGTYPTTATAWLPEVGWFER